LLGLLDRREELSRIRARLARGGLLGLAPRLRRRAALNVVHVPPALLVALEADASLVRTGISAAAPYGSTKFSQAQARTAYAAPSRAFTRRVIRADASPLVKSGGGLSPSWRSRQYCLSVAGSCRQA